MELLVVLLAISLSSSEKLNRGYLPPTGAKLAGGSSGDLQTPLEYPNINTFGTNDNGYPNFGETEPQNEARDSFSRNHDSLFSSGSNDERVSSIVTGNSNDYTQTNTHPINSFDTAVTEMVNDVGTQSRFGNRYPMKSVSIMHDIVKNGYHYGKPENMAIIGAKEGILPNNNLNAFEMYGVYPMIIKSKLDSVFEEPNGSFDYPSNDLYTSDLISRGSQNEPPVSPNTRQRTYQSTFKPVQTESSKTTQRNKVQNTLRKRPQRPQAESDKTAVVINYKNIINPNDYTYSFDTSNGIHMNETATITDGVKASGSYSYTGDDGKVYSVVYTADDNGFQPEGDHLPTPPPINEAIKRVIEQAKMDKQAGILHDGFYDEEKYGHTKYQGPVERYLQNMQVNPKPRSRNRDMSLRIIQRKPVLKIPKETEEYSVSEDNILQRNRSINNRPVSNINGRFGMKKVISVGNMKIKPTNNLNVQPSVTKFDRKNTIINKEVQSREFMRNNSVEMHNNFQGVHFGNDINMNEYKDPGYYYVPPRQVFIEGRLQDKPTVIESVNQFRSISEDSGTKSIPQSFYYVDQRNNVDNSKNLTDDLITERPDLNSQTYAGNYYTNQDYNVNNSEDKASTSIKTLITPKPYGNTLITDSYEQENTHNYKEYTNTEEGDENAATITGLDFINLSTTPMPSERKYPNILGDSNKYQIFDNSKGRLLDYTKFTNKYSMNEGYFITKPDIQVFFDDFPSSTYSPIYTVDEIKTETIQNIKVDGFGRPIQDIQQFYGNTNNYGYTESPYRADDKPKATETYFLEEPVKDKAATPKNDKTHFNLGTLVENAPKNVEIEGTDKIIGEDFSGPKQLQRYDPTSGYFY